MNFERKNYYHQFWTQEDGISSSFCLSMMNILLNKRIISMVFCKLKNDEIHIVQYTYIIVYRHTPENLNVMLTF